jgi:PAS domain S-box-containing protein
VQIDKTLQYGSSSIPAGKGYLYIPRKSEKLRLSYVSEGILKQLTRLFDNFISSEYSIVRIIILTTSAACFMFGIMGTDEFYYRPINIIQSSFGIMMLCMTYTDYGKKNIRHLGNLFIYMLDITNATLVATSHFSDKLSYQYIIYFFVSSLFFINKKSLLACIIMNSIIVFCFAFLPSGNSSSVSDFYISFIASEFGLAILMLKRFKTEAKLAENESKYRLLAENSADIICTHSARGDFDFVSPSISALTGYHPSELQGRPASQFIYADDRTLYTSMTAAGNNSVSEAFQYRFRVKDGSYIWLETVIRSLGDDINNSNAGFLSQTRSFQRHHEYLEQIERNTMELQTSYKDLEMFAYISSHDMQEPLRMISNYMQLLRRKYETKLDKDAMEYIDYAVKGASNLQALIKDLLSYSTINKKEITVSPIDMEVLLDDVLSSLQLLMQEKNVKVYINEPLITLMADKNAITQLVQNLIQNGIKYNISPSPIIRIMCSEDSRYVTYRIEDNGIGIDEQYAQQIFEPFQRLHNKHNFPGTGLGLSICRKIIDRLNGKIWVESKPGVGSSFNFSIPKSQDNL